MKCTFCPHECEITESNHGFCKTKALTPDKELVTLSYGQITSIALDPIEKKPLRRFFPGTRILSIGSWGCNMNCPWCQNDTISRGPADYYEMTPEDIVSEALRQQPNGNIGIAYTYNEALTNYDFVYDTAVMAHDNKLRNVLVTNGMIADDYLIRLLPYIDALNIDLKTIDEAKYRTIGGDLGSVLNTIKRAAKSSHVEVTTLIVPGFNDSEEEAEQIADTLAAIDSDIPLHISRFFPAGKMRDASPTEVGVIYRLKDIADCKLKYVYTGNC